MSKMNEELYKRLCKIKTLADRGVGGERDNAKELFASILAQHGLNESHFESFGEKDGWLEMKFVDDSYEQQLHGQVARSLGIKVYQYQNERKSAKGKTSIIKGPQSKVAEFEMTFNIYLDAWKEEMEVAFVAFVNINNIFPPKDDHECDNIRPRKELTAIERKAIMRASSMERTRIQKRLA